MENIQRDLAKEIAASHPSKPTRKNRHWTLLFVGGHGQVVAIRQFRWIIMTGVSLLVLAAVVCAILYYLYLHSRNVNMRLERSLDTVQQQIVELRRDKELLIAQIEVLRAGSPKPVENAPVNQPEDRAQNEPRGQRPGDRQTEGAVSGSAGVVPPADPENVPRVSIEGFNVSHEAATSTFRAQFVLRNTGPDSHPVSGYTAIILKKLNTPPDKWLTLPTLKLAAGVPTGDRVGQYFSIARFKSVRFMVNSKVDPQQFDAATVYVFDEYKDLLLEQNFSINIHKAVFTPNQ